MSLRPTPEIIQRKTPKQAELDRLYGLRTEYTKLLISSPANGELANSVRVALQRQSRMTSAIFQLPDDASALTVKKQEYKALEINL